MLVRVIRLVVNGQVNCLFALAHHSTGVASVAAVNFIGSDQGNSRSAASLHVLAKLSFPGISQHHLVDLHEGLFQSESIILSLKAGKVR